MSLYRTGLYPLLARWDAEQTHEATLALLRRAERWGLAAPVLRPDPAGRDPRLRVELAGLRFRNPVGLAAGFDKYAAAIGPLGRLGFGHLEVGTFTPAPQPGNPRPRIFRLTRDAALINRLGFPNPGAEAAARALAAVSPDQRRNLVLGVSLGKGKATPVERAAEDYVSLVPRLAPYADYLALNASSPNTIGLRRLQARAALAELLAAVQAANRALPEPRPLLVKIAPDLSWAEIDDALEVVLAAGCAGLIATNTTLAREGLRSAAQTEAGGLSGAPLAARSTAIVRHCYRQTGGRLPIVGVGGIFSAADALAKIRAGASLVQLYTGLVYQGPGLVGRICRGLKAEVERLGVKTIQELVGSEAGLA